MEKLKSIEKLLKSENMSLAQFCADLEIFRKGLEMCEEISEELFSKHFARSEDIKKLIYMQGACLQVAKMIASVPDKNLREDLVNNIICHIDYYLMAQIDPNVQDDLGK
jgi:hypothetical protein